MTCSKNITEECNSVLPDPSIRPVDNVTKSFDKLSIKNENATSKTEKTENGKMSVNSRAKNPDVESVIPNKKVDPDVGDISAIKETQRRNRGSYMLLYRLSDRSHEEKEYASSAKRVMLSVAPMMDVTTLDFRHYLRMVTKRTQLWTEMVVDSTILHQQNNLDKFLYFEKTQQPLVVQLGGSSPEHLARASEFCETYGYDEINLNCGCPSAKVVEGCFGAQLMLTPELVARCCKEMIRRVQTPVSVKCRLGADDRDSYEELVEFIHTVSLSGVKHFQVHARKCLLSGLSTKQNRSIPPIKYDWVRRLQQDFPTLQFSLNGHIQSLEDANDMLWNPNHRPLESAMLGRAAWKNPWMFSKADSLIFGETFDPIDSIVKKWNSRSDILKNRDTLNENRQIENIENIVSRNNNGCEDLNTQCGTSEYKMSSRFNVSREYVGYIEERLRKSVNKRVTVCQAVKPLLYSFNSIRGSKFFKQTVTKLMRKYSFKEDKNVEEEESFLSETEESFMKSCSSDSISNFIKELHGAINYLEDFANRKIGRVRSFPYLTSNPKVAYLSSN